MRSQFDDRFCPSIEVEYEATFRDNILIETRLIALAEVPPPGHDGKPIYIAIHNIPMQDLKWIMSAVHKDASERWEEAQA